MNTTTYNPDVQVRFTALDDSSLILETTLERMLSTAAIADAREVVEEVLQVDGTYYHPYHVRVGNAVGYLTVSLI